MELEKELIVGGSARFQSDVSVGGGLEVSDSARVSKDLIVGSTPRRLSSSGPPDNDQIDNLDIFVPQ